MKGVTNMNKLIKRIVPPFLSMFLLIPIFFAPKIAYSNSIQTALGHSSTSKNLVPYTGDVWNIFFHSLIVHKNLAFDGDKKERGYNYWMTTVEEFKSILTQLHKNNFVLVDINDTYEIKNVNSKRTLMRKTLYLPQGKKPLVLSLDDINYYDYMKGDGFADKLLFDKNGDVATVTRYPNGENVVLRDNDCIPILDKFVEDNPDFSHNGAKGIIGVTGYEGVLGYRTNNTSSPTYRKDVATVKALASKLKSTGWRFASHSYGHRHHARVSFERLKRDADKWESRVKPLVGETNLYIYPFGGTVPSSSAKFKYLQSKGFDVFFNVKTSPKLVYESGALLVNRANVDGYRMIKGPHHLSPLFDVETVVDITRPAIK